MRSVTFLALFIVAIAPGVPAQAQISPSYSAQGVVALGPVGGGAVAVDTAGRSHLVESASSQVNGLWGAWVTSVDADGRTVLWRTFVPVSGDLSLAVDAAGNTYVAGTTSTPDRVSATAWLGPHGSTAVAIVAKVRADGTRGFVTLVGGASGPSFASGIAAGADGSVYVTGLSQATDFPTTANALDSTANGGDDVVLFRLDPDGTALSYSTYMGGNAQDNAVAVAVDAAGRALVGGTTWSPNFPTTAGAAQRAWGGGGDGFVATIDTVSGALAYSTFAGGVNADVVRQVAFDANGVPAAAGVTYSPNFPVTADAEQPIHGDQAVDGADAFLFTLTSDGSAFRYSTYLGGDGWEWTEGLGVASGGRLVLAGRTTSSSFPITTGAVHAVPDAFGGADGFLTTFDPAGHIAYSTYLGLGNQTPPFAMALDSRSDAYVASGTFDDGFLLRLATRPALPLVGTATSEESPVLNGPAAVDGDPWTRWSSDFSSPQWLIADFGGRVEIDRVVINWETAYSKSYLVQVAEDGADPSDNSSWRTVYNTTSGNGGIDDLRLSTVGRYLRLVGQERATPWGHSVWEFVAFGTSTEAPNARPSVTLTEPADLEHFDPGTSITISATAADPDGSIAHVGFYVNGSLIADVTGPPYSTTFMTSPGSFSVSAVAYDDRGAASLPSTASIFVSSEQPIDLAAGRPVFASSVEGDAYGAANAVDGNPATRWSSAFSDPQWLAVDLGMRTRVEEVVLSWETAFATAFELQVSDDAQTWTTIYSTSSGTGGQQRLWGLAGTGRYVRMLGQARATQWGYSLWSVQVYGSATAEALPNVALGRPAFASSVEADGYAARFAVDGDPSTRWSSAFSSPQWLAVDLGGFFDISRAVLRWEQAFATSYEIQVSNDAVTWRSIRFVDSDGGVDDLTLPSSVARFVRVLAYARATEWGVSLWEFEVYGAPAPLTGNLARSGSAFASSAERADTPAAAAVDGLVDTRWSSAFSDAQWLAVDLGAPADLRRVVVNWEAAYASRYEVQVSSDGLSWMTVASSGGGDGGLDDFSIAARARYVRIWCQQRGTEWGYSIWELEVYGAAPFN